MNDKIDYYRILGVVRDAALKEITAAYHGLVHKYHPDLGEQDVDALEKLRLINEAYSVLSDRSKRRDYDQVFIGRSMPINIPVQASTPFPSANNSYRNSTSELAVEVPISPEEAMHGGPCDFKVTTNETCQHCNGSGHTRNATCRQCEGKGNRPHVRNFSLQLPPRTQDGTVVRFPDDQIRVTIRIRPYW